MNVTLDLQPVTRLTLAGNNVEYSSVAALSATGKYVMTSDRGAAVNIYDRATKTIAYAKVPQVNIAYAWWDKHDDDKIWYVYGACIFYRLLNSGVVQMVADLSKPSGNRPAMPDLQTGNGTCDVRPDGWLAIMSNQARTIGAVDLTGLTPANQESHIKCAPYGGMADVNYVDMTELDSVSRKRYVLAAGAPESMVYSVGNKGLDFEYALSPDPFQYGITPHSAIGATEDGQQFLVWSRYNWKDRYDVVAAFFNKGATLIDECLYLYPSNMPGSGAHFGANSKGMIVHSIYDAVDPMPFPDDPLRNSIIVTEIGKDARIIVQPHGSNALNGNYWATPRASIATDGQCVAYVSNMGNAAENPSVYVVPTRGSQPLPPTLEQRVAELEKWRAEVAKASRP